VIVTETGKQKMGQNFLGSNSRKFEKEDGRIILNSI
jgi:hypothetical protein